MSESHIDPDVLQDFADGTLPDAARSAVTAHLAACEECTREARSIESLLDDLGRLPRGIAPDRDLLPGIAARIDAEPAATVTRRIPLGERSLRSLLPWLAAAAVILTVGSSAMTAVVLRQQSAGEIGTSAAADVRNRVEREYAAAVRDLEASLAALTLPHDARALLDRSIAKVDSALAEADAALAADPGNPLLAEMLLTGYERKLGLLRQATTALATL